jgi:small-conductance mechanosensitive channel
MIRPDAQLRAGHVPADLIPPGVDPGQVVIVQQAPRSYVGPVCLVLVSTIGAAGVVVAILALLQVAAQTATAVAAAAPAGIGLSIALRRKGK